MEDNTTPDGLTVKEASFNIEEYLQKIEEFISISSKETQELFNNLVSVFKESQKEYIDAFNKFQTDYKFLSSSSSMTEEELKEFVEVMTETLQDKYNQYNESFNKLNNTLEKNINNKNEKVDEKSDNQDQDKDQDDKAKIDTSEFQNFINKGKEFFKSQKESFNTFVKDLPKKLEKNLMTTSKNIFKGLTGPLSLITNPLEDIIGIDLQDVAANFIGKKFFSEKKDKKKKDKKQPVTSIVDTLTPTPQLLDNTSINNENDVKKSIIDNSLIQKFFNREEEDGVDKYTTTSNSLTNQSFGKNNNNLSNFIQNFSKDISSEDDKKRIAPDRTTLLQYGVLGAGFVYVGDIINKLLMMDAEQEAPDIDLKGGITKKLLTGLGISAPAIAGIAAFTALKWKDITESFKLFQNKNFGKGIQTLLLGSPEDITEENASKGVVKQSAAYGLGALGVGTTIAGIGALSGGASLGSALLTGLATAFPPALIAAGVAALAKGIQTAWVLGWDERAKEASNKVKEVFADEDSSWWDKTKSSIGYVGKGIFGGMAAGIKNVIKDFDMRDIWADEEKNILEKIGGSGLRIIKGFFTAPFDFITGFGSTIGDYFWNILPNEAQDKIVETKDLIVDSVFGFMKSMTQKITNFFNDIKDSEFGKRARKVVSLAGDVKRKISQTWEKVGNSINSFFVEVQERGLKDVIGGAVINVKDKVKDVVNSAIPKITGFFTDIFDSVEEFFAPVMDEIRDFIDHPLDYIKNKAVSLGEVAGEKISNVGTSIKETVSESRVGQFFSNVFNRDNVTEVNDAIITPQGKVIQTNPNDYIVATQTPQTGISKAIQETSKVLETHVEIHESQELLSGIRELIQVIKDKPFNNIITQQSPNDFDFEGVR